MQAAVSFTGICLIIYTCKETHHQCLLPNLRVKPSKVSPPAERPQFLHIEMEEPVQSHEELVEYIYEAGGEAGGGEGAFCFLLCLRTRLRGYT